jgi:hypothetical protein
MKTEFDDFILGVDDPCVDLLYYAWQLITTVGHDEGSWDGQPDEWIAAAYDWRDRWVSFMDKYRLTPEDMIIRHIIEENAKFKGMTIEEAAATE